MSTQRETGRAAAYTTPAVLRPSSAGERVAAVDILRGLAIFGILPINIYYFGHPWFVDFASFVKMTGLGSQWPSLDRAVHAVVFFLSNDILYSLFAFLFAFGMATLMARAQACGTSFVRLYVRRLLVLLAFGGCHAVFFWAGDILTTYAILGFLLLAFRKRADSTLIASAAVCLSIGIFGFAGLVVLSKTAEAAGPVAAVQPATATSPSSAATTSSAPAPAAAIRTAGTSFADVQRQWVDKTVRTYAHGTYPQILRWRLVDFITWIAAQIFIEYPRILGMFLLGLWAGRRGILHDIPAHLRFIRKVAIRGAILGAAASLTAILVRWYYKEGMVSTSWSGLVAFAGDAVRIPSLCLATAAAVVLLARNDAWLRRLRPLAAVGRMSLSNYLL